jgi:hypothetical protein
MNATTHTEVEPQRLDIARPVAESMDHAIGEATTVMGALVTELMRRSLRGGVLKIGEQLQGYVGEHVDRTIAERRPAIEQAAADVAEETAHITASKVAAEEVHSLEARTTEAARELAQRMEQGDQQAVEVTHATARELTGKIQEAEQRVSQATQAEIGQRVRELTDKATEGAKILRARLKAIVRAAAETEKQLGALRAELTGHVDELRRENEALHGRVADLEKPRGLGRLWAWLFRRKKR